MAGERTPDTSTARSAGSSDDDISLREHMQRQIDREHQSYERLLAEQAAYFDMRFLDARELLNERFEAQKKAVEELKTTTTQRFESVNEFRAQLNDQARLFMGRDESISRHERNAETMTAMGLRHDNELRLMRERFDEEVKTLRARHEADMALVNSRLDLTQGQTTGADKTWGVIFAGAAFVATLVGLIAYAIGAQ